MLLQLIEMTSFLIKEQLLEFLKLFHAWWRFMINERPWT